MMIGRWILVLLVLFIFNVLHVDAALAEDSPSCQIMPDVYAVAFSPDGNQLAVSGRPDTIQLWDVTTGKKSLELLFGNKGLVRQVIYSPNGKYLAASSNQFVVLWEFPTGALLDTFQAQIDSGGLGLYFTLDSKQLLVADDSGGSLWDIQSGKKIHNFYHPGSYGGKTAELSADGKYVLTNGENGVWLWDVKTGEVIQKFLNKRAGQNGFGSLFPDGQNILIAEGYETGLVFVWNIDTRKEIQKIILGEQRFWWQISPNGQYILVFYDEPDSIAEIWDATSGTKLFLVSMKGVGTYYGYFTPDNKRVLINDKVMVTKVPKAFDTLTFHYNVWNLENHMLVNRFTTEDDISVLRFAPQQDYMAFVLGRGTVQIWDSNTFKKIRELC